MTGPDQGAAAGGRSLEQMLAPGEEVLYRESEVRRSIISATRTWCANFCVVGLILCAVGGVLAVAEIAGKFPLLFLGLGWVLLVLGLMQFLEWHHGRRTLARCDALVTETRALYWNEATTPVADEFLMTDIAAAEELSSDEGGVRIVKRDGTAVVWTDLENPRYFAGLLRVTSGLTSPCPAYYLYNMDMIFFLTAYLAFPVLLLVLAFAGFSITAASLKSLEAFFTLVLAVSGAAAISFAGLHVARLSMLLRKWRRRSPETIHAWLWPRFYDSEFERRILERWLLNPLYRRLASSLYGDALGSVAREEASHG